MKKKINFVHLADLHLGGWREKTISNLNFETFRIAIDEIIDQKPDFAIFAGDIFNNALPPIELVQKVSVELLKLKENNIPLYVIGGSHDYSNTSKSFIELLDTIGVFHDLNKFKTIGKNKIELNFIEDQSGAVLCGVLGKKNGLDKNIYENLSKQNLSKEKLNIFVFHATLNDFKPDFMKAVSSPVKKSYLPEGFDYYAGGHIHTHMEGEYSTGILSYPGPLFPNNFSEIKREKPSYNICEFDFDNREIKIKRKFLNTYEKIFINVELNMENPVVAKGKIEERISNLDVENKIVLLEISGIVDGKTTDISINSIVSKCYERGALQVLKNTYKLSSSKIQTYDIDNLNEPEKIEEEIIKKSLENSNDKLRYLEITKTFLLTDFSKKEDEKIYQYEERIGKAFQKVLNS